MVTQEELAKLFGDHADAMAEILALANRNRWASERATQMARVANKHRLDHNGQLDDEKEAESSRAASEVLRISEDLTG